MPQRVGERLTQSDLDVEDGPLREAERRDQVADLIANGRETIHVQRHFDLAVPQEICRACSQLQPAQRGCRRLHSSRSTERRAPAPRSRECAPRRNWHLQARASPGVAPCADQATPAAQVPNCPRRSRLSDPEPCSRIHRRAHPADPAAAPALHATSTSPKRRTTQVCGVVCIGDLERGHQTPDPSLCCIVLRSEIPRNATASSATSSRRSPRAESPYRREQSPHDLPRRSAGYHAVPDSVLAKEYIPVPRLGDAVGVENDNITAGYASPSPPRITTSASAPKSGPVGESHSTSPAPGRSSAAGGCPPLDHDSSPALGS